MLVQQLPSLPSLWWALLIVPLTALVAWRRVFIIPSLFVIGAVWVTLQAGLILQDSLPQELEGKDLWVEGTIADLPKDLERGFSTEFDVARAKFDDEPVKIPHRIRLNITNPELHPRIGDEWGFLVRLKRPHGFQNPGGFDYEGHLFSERIRATGYVRAEQAPRLIASNLYSYPIGRFRQWLGERIHAALAQSPMAGLITAFANGDQGGISDAQWEVLRRTGTTHLIAISGMNIGLVAGIVYFLVRWLWAIPGYPVLRLPAQKAAAVVALAAAVFYSALAGFAIPTQRAIIMLAVVLGAILLNRAVRPPQLLATALLLVLIYDPLAVMSTGFWLSFASVAVILLSVQGRVREAKWKQWGRLQWVVAVGLLPLLLLLFQQTSLSGPFANMLAIPVIESLVIPVTLLGALCVVLLPQIISSLLFQFAAWVMGLLWKALEYLSGLEYSLWVQHAPVSWALPVGLIGIVWLLMPRGWPARWVGTIGLLPLFLMRPPGPSTGEVWLTLLDVGQGLAAVVRTHQHVLIFDTGARFSARFDAGRAALVPYLRATGVDDLDVLLVSHGDNDHIGGAQSLLAAFPAKHILSGVPERLPGAVPCQAGQTWRWDDVDFTVLNPPEETSFRGNNAGCVLLVTSRHGTLLLPADIETEAEQSLLEAWNGDLHADVLVAPHHGSKTSSTEVFIDAVQPQLTLLPVGYRNRYKHPHPIVVERYQQRGIRLLDSPASGAITVKMGTQGMTVSSYRQDAKRYWFAP